MAATGHNVNETAPSILVGVFLEDTGILLAGAEADLLLRLYAADREGIPMSEVDPAARIALTQKRIRTYRVGAPGGSRLVFARDSRVTVFCGPHKGQHQACTHRLCRTLPFH